MNPARPFASAVAGVALDELPGWQTKAEAQAAIRSVYASGGPKPMPAVEAVALSWQHLGAGTRTGKAPAHG